MPSGKDTPLQTLRKMALREQGLTLPQADVRVDADRTIAAFLLGPKPQEGGSVWVVPRIAIHYGDTVDPDLRARVKAALTAGTPARMVDVVRAGEAKGLSLRYEAAKPQDQGPFEVAAADVGDSHADGQVIGDGA